MGCNIYNIVLVLPIEYDCVTKVEDTMEYDNDEVDKHKHVCYFVMNNGCIEEQNTFFKRPNESMKSHLKPLFIGAQVENTRINNILING